MPAPTQAPMPAGVVNVPLSQIKTNKSLFQNREDDYSQESVNRILAAVNAGTFRFGMTPTDVEVPKKADRQKASIA
ncbi:hypothetical protein [Xanthocytophaga agilis]|uniref:Uncharacterized protein n=1 Tax=Xanthocytophaga agilis TaxID=3048010 RepID=A0AAE3RCM0_9BACT|nr:hypothetical protein [Xanthocytophaga agilis]MDJ1505163.1 hypothetical protein [Xanthocytophaga agilis]